MATASVAASAALAAAALLAASIARAEGPPARTENERPASTGTPLLSVGINDQISEIRASPDESRVWVINQNQTAFSLIDTSTGRVIKEIQLPRKADRSQQAEEVKFSPDHSTLGVRTNRGEIYLYDLKTGEMKRSLESSLNYLTFEFLPGGRLVASATDGKIRVYRTSDGQSVTDPIPHGAHVRVMKFSDDQTLIATKSADRKIRVFRAEDFQPLKQIEFPDAIRDMAFAPGGEWVAGSYIDPNKTSRERIRVSRVGVGSSEGTSTFDLSFDRGIREFHFSPDGKKFFVIDRGGKLNVVYSETGALASRDHLGGGEALRMAFSPDGSRMAVYSQESGKMGRDDKGTLTLISLTDENRQSVRVGIGNVSDISFDSLGRVTLFGGTHLGNSVLRYDPHHPPQGKVVLSGSAGYKPLYLERSGKFVGVGPDGKTVLFYDARPEQTQALRSMAPASTSSGCTAYQTVQLAEALNRFAALSGGESEGQNAIRCESFHLLFRGDVQGVDLCEEGSSLKMTLSFSDQSSIAVSLDGLDESLKWRIRELGARSVDGKISYLELISLLVKDSVVFDQLVFKYGNQGAQRTGFASCVARPVNNRGGAPARPEPPLGPSSNHPGGPGVSAGSRGAK